MSPLASIEYQPGRVVQVVRFHLARTYEGVLIVDDSSFRTHFNEQLQAHIKDLMGHFERGHMVQPPDGRLPDYWFIAKLESTPIASPSEFDRSEALLGSFLTTPSDSIYSMVIAAAKDVRWEDLAVDTYDD